MDEVGLLVMAGLLVVVGVLVLGSWACVPGLQGGGGGELLAAGGGGEGAEVGGGADRSEGGTALLLQLLLPEGDLELPHGDCALGGGGQGGGVATCNSCICQLPTGQL